MYEINKLLHWQGACTKFISLVVCIRNQPTRVKIPYAPPAHEVISIFSISYQIMLDCWRENPVDRPTFERLRNTMKEMEGNHKVRGVRTFSKREKQSWIRKVHLGKKLIIIQGLKLREACSTSLPPSYLSKRLIQY